MKRDIQVFPGGNPFAKATVGPEGKPVLYLGVRPLYETEKDATVVALEGPRDVLIAMLERGISALRSDIPAS